MKQCDFDVIQLVYGDSGFYGDFQDNRVKRIGRAAAYCKQFGLVGINTLVFDMLKKPGIFFFQKNKIKNKFF